PTELFPILLLLRRFAVHCQAFRRTRFVNDAFKQSPDRRVTQRPFVVVGRVGQHFVFPRGLVNRHPGGMLQPTDFQRALRAFVEKFDELFIDLVHLAPPVGDIHIVASRRERPLRPASFRDCTRSRNAAAAASTEGAFSISDTRAEPTTAASARPPSTETCPGSEM